MKCGIFRIYHCFFNLHDFTFKRRVGDDKQIVKCRRTYIFISKFQLTEIENALETENWLVYSREECPTQAQKSNCRFGSFNALMLMLWKKIILLIILMIAIIKPLFTVCWKLKTAEANKNQSYHLTFLTTILDILRMTNQYYLVFLASCGIRNCFTVF